MRFGCAILLLALSTQFAFAQTLDKAKFRQAIELPAISTHFNVEFKANERNGRGVKYDPLRKIEELQKKLTGGFDDAEIYLEQRAVFLECIKEKDKQKEVADKAQQLIDKAEATLRPVVASTDPKHGILLTTYGAILETTHDSPWIECEKLARRAVALTPNDWRAWAYLAHVRHQQFPALVCGGSDKNLPREGRTQEILGKLYLQRCKAAHVAEAEKALNEALHYHDKARELAPSDPKRQIERYGFRLTEIVLRNAIAGYRGQKPPYQMQQLERIVLDELEAAARLNVDHLLWQSQLVHQLVLLGWQQKEGDTDGPPIKKFRPARPEDAQAIKEALARIEKIADASSGEAAVFCHSMLAALYSSMQENATVEKHARKVLEIDSKNQMAAEQLQQALFLQDRFAEQRSAAQKHVELVPTPRNCYFLAKALGFNQRYDLAEQTILAGLKLDPNDAYCLMGRAALLMRGGDDAATLNSARDFLDRARRNYRAEDGALGFTELECLTAVHYALSGDVALAQLKLQHLRSQNPDNVRYGKLLSAFSSKK